MTDSRDAIDDPPTRLTFLVVEEDILLRIATASYLRDQGFDVMEAADANQAIRLLDHTTVDAVFTDTSMLGSLTAHSLDRRRRRPASSGQFLPTSNIERAGEDERQRERTLLHRGACGLLQ
jgi:CheY-like chemotaxis protein